MAKMFQGKQVTVVRSAKPDDAGYDKAKGAQSLIKLADGTEKVVADKEVTDSAHPDQQPV